MKKLMIALTSWVLFAPVPVFAAPQEMVVSRITGQPQIMRQNQLMPVSVGMRCQTGDTLKTTAPGCDLDLAVNGLAGCRVLPFSECVIVNGSPSDMRLQIKSGNAILNLKKLPPGSTFQIETPTAIAAVRGTQFWGRVDTANINNPVTTFAVRQGVVTVFLKNTGENFSLQKGQALDIPKNASVAPLIRPALREELKAMEQASSIQTSV